MNANIRRLGLFFLLAFAAILAGDTYWQVIDASALQARPDNHIRLEATARVQRGFILDRNGTVVAGRNIDSNGIVHRYYTDPSLSQVIGYDSPLYGKTELEQSYDAALSGQVFGSNWKAVLDQWEHKPVVGDNVTLTIDDRLQTQVANLMPNTPSAAIVANPHTGEILAMVSKPGFDANKISDPAYWNSLRNDPNAVLINRAVDGFYPPGSTFKIVTLGAALDSGTQSPSTVFAGQNATGPLTVDGYTFPASISNLQDCGPYATATQVTLTQALMCSDNIVFAEVGLSLGASRFLDYTHRFGLDQSTPFDIPVSQSFTQTAGENFNAIELASTAFGQGGLHVTPLQMLMATEAPANGGVIPKPVLVQKVTAPDGSTVSTGAEGALYSPISGDTANAVRDAMVKVVEDPGGSGFEAQIPGIQVAGKTGTAETSVPGRPHAWFVSFAPANNPQIAVVVIVEHVDANAGEGGYNVAAPLAKQIMQAAQSLGYLSKGGG